MWTKVPLDEKAPRLAWVGDRFVLADVSSGSVRTSTDGASWQILQPGDPDPGYLDLLRGSHASWQDKAVGWWNPQDPGVDIAGAPPITARDVVQLVHPPAAPSSTTPFKGRIESIGIGPKGIVAEVHSALDLDAWITKKLGLRTNNDWTCCVKSLTLKNGVLELKLTNRRGLKFVWADQGFESGDFQDGGFGWYSPDGEHWTEMAPNDADYPSPGAPPSNLPTGFGHVVGVSDGFIASGGYPDGACSAPDGSCTGMWYSADGLTWRFLGLASDNSLLPWLGGALVYDGAGHFDLWTSTGSSRLPVAADLQGTIGTGPLGLVIVSRDDKKTLVSRDGIDFGISPIPAEMADANSSRGGPTVAVGDRNILVLEWRRIGEFTMNPSLWLCTLER